MWDFVCCVEREWGHAPKVLCIVQTCNNKDVDCLEISNTVMIVVSISSSFCSYL